jgi:hypothetical protein
MELADPTTIAALLDAAPRPKRPRGMRGTRVNDGTSVRVPAARRCVCGTCFHCKENARWDRIFKEKFADPLYYRQRVVSQGSSLGWLPRP